MKLFPLLFCLALAVGCARVHTTFAPSAQHRLLQLEDANGVPTWALLPPGYKPQVESPWIVYNHGSGQSISSILSDPVHYSFVQSLAAAGFVVLATEYRNITCWGDMECVEDVANLQTLWRSRLNLSPQPFVIGESMGGIVSWNALSHGTLKPLAVAAIYPVCNLASMYAESNFAPAIQLAYDFSYPFAYAAATRGFDPILIPPSTFAGIPIQMWASYSDWTVLRSQNEDPFANAINAAGGSVTIHTTRGGHGDPSNLDAPAVISFFSSHIR